jgi:L-ascorbate metabolism protein UlaG (beta-lactamase superfamily)
LNWKLIKRWPWDQPFTLRVADRLGRNRGRLRVLDAIHPPPPAPHRPDLSRWEQSTLAAAWIGHATMLLRVGGRTILTDPVLSTRVGLGLGLMTGGPKRLVAPALSLDELPPLDLILISHAHFDHLDRPTLYRLSKKTPVITSEHNRDLIADLGFRDVSELRWGESHAVGGLRVTACEVNHWGARTVLDRHRGYAGFLLEGDGRRVLYGGDSAYHERFQGLGKVDLAVIGIGAYNPWIESHATPEQAWAMANHMRPDFVVPMHHSTFKLSSEPRHEPMERLLAAAGREAERVVIHQVGEAWYA